MNRQRWNRIVLAAIAFFLVLWLAPNLFVTVWYARTPLVPSERQQFDEFGSVATIAEDTIVVSAPHYSFGNIRSGTAYVFVRSGSGWIEQAKLIPEGNPRNWVGFSRNLSISGNTIAAGDFTSDGVYIFTRNGTTWSQQAKLTAPADGTTTLFAKSVAIEGDVLVVGDMNAPHVYLRDPATNKWSYQTALQPTPVSDRPEQEGFPVAISNGVIVVNGTGRALVFARGSDGVTWQQQAELKLPSGRTGGGCPVAISGDTIVVGACNERVGLQFAPIGVAHVFERNPKTGQWNYRTRLTPIGAQQKFLSPYGFGSVVAIDGDAIVVSSQTRSSFFPSRESAAYLFQRNRWGWWLQRAKILVDDPEALSNVVTNADVMGREIVVGGGRGAYVLDMDSE